MTAGIEARTSSGERRRWAKSIACACAGLALLVFATSASAEGPWVPWERFAISGESTT
jgi:hypothetical protein